jgi:DNA-binding CsgD family transcriptional regulator
MPDYQLSPADHDPFGGFVPVDHDPFGAFAPIDHDPFALPGEPQRQSRGEILGQGLDKLRDFLTPGYLRDTPSSPQADRALADPNARPGKIGPPSGPPTTAQMIGGLGADVASNMLPLGKLTPLLAGGVPWTKAELATIEKTFTEEAAIAKLPGRSDSAVQKKMNQMGLHLQDHPNYVSARNFDSDPEKVSRALELMSKNKTDIEIANELGVHPDTVRRFRRVDLDIPATRRLSDDPDTIAQYQDMVKQGLSQEQMAVKLKKNVGTVSRQLAALQRHDQISYTPGGGIRTPSLPSFKFMQDTAGILGDKEYEKALNEHLAKHGYGITVEAVDHDPFAGTLND